MMMNNSIEPKETRERLAFLHENMKKHTSLELFNLLKEAQLKAIKGRNDTRTYSYYQGVAETLQYILGISRSIKMRKKQRKPT